MNPGYGGQRTADWCVALGTANCTSILVVTGLLADQLARLFAGGAVGPMALVVLTLLRAALLIIALVVSGVVTSNAYGIVAAGQARGIALRRLLGASAAAERKRVLGRAMRRAVPVAALAAVVTLLLCLPLVNALLAAGSAPTASAADLASCLPAAAIGLLAQLACVRWAVGRGYAPVLAGGPIAAVRVADDPEHRAAGRPVKRWVRGCAWAAAGTASLALLAALTTPYAILPGLVAGALSAAAVLGSADRVVGRLVGVLSRRARPGSDLDVAGRRLRQHGVRSSRAALAVAVGVCVVTMLGVASGTAFAAVDGYFAAATGVSQGIAGIVFAGAAMISLTALTSALGVVTTISYGLRLRHREIALLRVLGQTPRHTRRMIRAEAGLLSAGGVVLGLACGVGYGWFGAQVLLSRPTHSLVLVPVLPLTLLLAVALGAAALTWVASAWPAREVLRRPAIRTYLEA